MKKGKTQAQRHAEVYDALKQLTDLGLTADLEGVAKFIAIVDDFLVRGFHASGDIPVPGTQRRIVYKLSMQPHIPSMIVLKHDPNV